MQCARFLAVLLAALAAPRAAFAQACCASGSSVTPGRLAVHEDALVGLTAKGSYGLGSFDTRGTFHGTPAHASEWELEQDVFGSVRVLRHAQVSMLVPLLETWRTTATAKDSGGGLGDLNVGGRYDFVEAGTIAHVPGIAALVGLTLPTGRPPERAGGPLAASATGVGAFQANIGLSVEGALGSWTLSGAGIVAQRFGRTVNGVDTTLGTQLTMIGAAIYSATDDLTFSAALSYSLEGRAEINGVVESGTARRQLLVNVGALYARTDHLRFQGGVFVAPPLPALSTNQLAPLGLSLGVIYAWL